MWSNTYGGSIYCTSPDRDLEDVACGEPGYGLGRTPWRGERKPGSIRLLSGEVLMDCLEKRQRLCPLGVARDKVSPARRGFGRGRSGSTLRVSLVSPRRAKSHAPTRASAFFRTVVGCQPVFAPDVVIDAHVECCQHLQGEVGAGRSIARARWP